MPTCWTRSRPTSPPCSALATGRFVSARRGPGAFHPTLTRVWCRKGRRGQRLVEAPGANAKVYGFGILDWCDGWFDGFLAPGRTAAAFCAQVRMAVARSRSRGRMAIVLADNLRTHTPAGSKLVRHMLAELDGHQYLVYTPPYDPDAKSN